MAALGQFFLISSRKQTRTESNHIADGNKQDEKGEENREDVPHKMATVMGHVCVMSHVCGFQKSFVLSFVCLVFVGRFVIS